MSLIENLKAQIRGKKPTIVFPEGNDRRVLRAAIRLYEEGDIKPIVLGNRKEIDTLAKNEGLELKGLEVIDPERYDRFEAMVHAFVARRAGKVTIEDAREILKNPNYFGTMLIYLSQADGMVSGAIHTTGDTVRPALQIIKTKEGVSRVSGAMIMIKGDEMLLMADCAINPDLDEDSLAELAVVSEKTARQFGMDPKVAMLSFSTKGSAKHERVDIVRNATEKAKKMNPDMVIDGEMQFDAAYVESVGAQKAPDSPIKGDANVFIFPSLEAANIGYKIGQRLGGYEAVGPILQGLNKPVNDLSRGTSEDEVYALAIITAAQAIL